MYLRYEELLDYVDPPELPVEPLSPDSQERICELTMKKINAPTQHRKLKKALRWVTAAAVLVLALCGTALAAVENGWFGFDRIFAGQPALIDDGVTAYSPEENYPTTLPGYTEEEQAMIEDGTMFVPEQAELADTGVSASTEDFQFTLEQMLAGEDVLYAIVRVDALTEAGTNYLASASFDWEPRQENRFSLLVRNNADGLPRERELNNGAMDMDVLSVEDGEGRFLLSNTGGRFAEGDPILFTFSTNEENYELFEVPLGKLLDSKATVALDTGVYEGKGYQFEIMTVTPISLEINGTYTGSTNQCSPEVVITLKDGTSFALSSPGTDNQNAPYGEYGSLYHAGTASVDDDAEVRETWSFSKLVDLGEIETITVDGVDYTLE